MENNYAYLNSGLPIEKRIDDLIEKMTLAEKLAQLGSVYAFAGQFNESELAQGIGHFAMSSGSTSVLENMKIIRKVQKYLLSETRLQIPALIHVETLNGIALHSSTVYPVPLALAASFDVEAVRKMATKIAEEMDLLGIHMALAPVLDISRDPRWGRMSETYGESLNLVSSMGAAYISGFQGTKAFPCPKHFIAYAMGEGGLNMSHIHIGNRELRETYATPFEFAIKEENLKAVMNAYSAIDGEPILAVNHYLKNLLRDELGFKGITVSDYASIDMLQNIYHLASSPAEAGKIALESGMDSELPQTYCYGDELLRMFEEQELDIDLIEAPLRRILKLKFELGLFDEKFRDNILAGGEDFVCEQDEINDKNAINIFRLQDKESLQLSYELASESFVLLKNDSCLPIDTSKKENILDSENKPIKIAIIGEHFQNLRVLFGSYTYPSFYDGMKEIFDDIEANIIQEGMNVSLEAKRALRSSLSKLDCCEDMIRNSYIGIETVEESLQRYILEKNLNVELKYTKGIKINGEVDEDLNEVIELSNWADYTILLFGGLSGSCKNASMGENLDSTSISPSQLIEKFCVSLADNSKKFIVIHMDGRPLSSEIILEKASAVLEVWHPGQCGSRAIVEMLFGDLSPSGSLPVSLLRNSGQIPLYHEQYWGSGARGRSSVKDMVRDYVDSSSLPLRHFGYGLSYGEFEYSNFYCDSEIVSSDKYFEISFDITNKSRFKCATVSQIYYRDTVASLARVQESLLAFGRHELLPNETKHIRMFIPLDLLAFIDRDGRWIIEAGDFEFYLSESADLRNIDNNIQKARLKLCEDRILPKGRTNFKLRVIEEKITNY